MEPRHPFNAVTLETPQTPQTPPSPLHTQLALSVPHSQEAPHGARGQELSAGGPGHHVDGLEEDHRTQLEKPLLPTGGLTTNQHPARS